MKAIKIALVMILGLNLIYSVHKWFFADDGTKQAASPSESYQPVQESQAADDGLSLLGLTALVKEIRSGQELERRLNETNGINNLDLNGDNTVDYLKVKEFGDVNQKIGYSVTTEPVKGEVQEVAEVTVEKNGDKAEIQVIGNEQIYGTNAIYNDFTPIKREQSTDVVKGTHGLPLYSSYFFPHPLWISPWLFGMYPSFFVPFPVVGRTAYAGRVGRYDSPSIKKGRNDFQQKSRTRIQNPDKGKAASKGITRSLKNPTKSQKSFQAAQSKTTRSGGFGQASRSTTTGAKPKSGSSSSFGTSSSKATSGFGTTQRRSSSFGSRSSTFGSRSSSSSGSFRSRSFGSRSFSFGK